MKVFSTTNDNYVVDTGDEKFYFDKLGNPYKGDPEKLGELSTPLRSTGSICKSLVAAVENIQNKRKGYALVDNIYGINVLLKIEDLSLNMEIEDEIIPYSKEQIEGLRQTTKELEFGKISTKADEYKLGDRVLMYGPTGTGKTFKFLQVAKDLIDKWELDDYYVCTISEGFEDTDFLARVVPAEGGGVMYIETQIVQLLRDASEGKRVAILFDELNRGAKSFMNLILKLLDAVDGEHYVLHNFFKDEFIKIPIENILFVAAMNLGGKYTGTNSLDEALLDRFNYVLEKSYDPVVENEYIKNFAPFEKEVTEIVANIRTEYQNGSLRAPVSTRGISYWAKNFINTGKTSQELFKTFEQSLMNRIVSVDDFGLANEQEKAQVAQIFIDKKITI